MADTADRRSEGDLSSTPNAKNLRGRYRRLKALGLCVTCGVKETAGKRSVCYDCSAKNVVSSRLSHVRSVLEELGCERRPNPDDYTNAEKILLAEELMRMCK